ncbi:MAG: gamma-glutamyl-gamma-aminobutyrate hydrolase family protein [Elusimicrobiota bacterium]
MKPRVAVVSRRILRKNKWVNWVSEIHMALLIREGLLPVIVPIPKETRPCLEEYARGTAGLLMVEGGDIHPSQYGSRTPASELDEIDALKDEFEFWFCRRALRRNLPILGICRGHQILNVVFGGTLHADVQKEKKSRLKHMDLKRYDAHRHPVRLLEGTPLREWYGRDELSVNSYHHQGIKDLAEPLRPMAVSADGLVEAVHHPGLRFCVGLQFHPERMLPAYKGNRRVYREFAKAVKARRA